MPDDTITSSWKRFTDEVSGLRGEPADDHFAEVASAPFLQDKDGAHRAPGSSALLRLAELRSSSGGHAAAQLSGLARTNDPGVKKPSDSAAARLCATSAS
jgi:hypothetical protein